MDRSKVIYFKHPQWDNRMPLTVHEVAVIVVENQALLWRYGKALLAQQEGDGDEFLLQVGLDDYPFTKRCTVEVDLFNISLNSKKTQNYLIKRCVSLAHDENNTTSFLLLSQQIQKFCNTIGFETGQNVVFDEGVDAADLFKMLGVAFEDNHCSLLEKLCDYVSLYAEVFGIKVFFFFFLTKFLTLEEISCLHTHMIDEDLILVMFESDYNPELVVPHKAIIIDQDECEILKNFIDENKLPVV